MLRKEKHTKIYLDENIKTKEQTNLTIQIEKVKQNILAKEETLKRYKDRVRQYKQKRTFQNNERNFYLQEGGECMRTNQLTDTKEAKECRPKIWQRKEPNRKTKWISIIKNTRSLRFLRGGHTP